MLLVPASGSAAAEAPRTQANTNLSLDFILLTAPRGPAAATSYVGHISSQEKRCREDRKITVYRKRPGDDQKIGAGRSDKSSHGSDTQWEITKPGEPKNGRYYAKANATNKCEGDKSETVRIANDP